MAGYTPINVKGWEVGLVQDRQEHLLPKDAFPTLENAIVFRETIKRKQGYQFLGRLQRSVTIAAPNNTNSLLMGLEATATLTPGSLQVTGSGGTLWTDPGKDGVLVPNVATPNGTVNYATGVISGPTPPNTGTFDYYPGLPVMGIRTFEQTSINQEETIFFDQVYAYIFDNTTGQFKEFIPGTTWTGSNSEFFWSTNYWVADNNSKLFWVTNFNFLGADPIRYTDGVTWTDFQGQLNNTSVAADQIFILQAQCILPFRGRLVMFNTFEGHDFGSGKQYSNRIRWSQIGSPLTAYSAGPPVTGAWLDDVRGRGGFLNIPTNEDIISVGFVRDNVVIYCERSTWQLRYTGRSIAPFQIEKVNSELGVESTFSGVQFDTSIIGVGNVGIIECDSYKSERIDLKIVDLVYQFNNANDGVKRVHGIRDFVQKLAYWTYPDFQSQGTYPDRRLVYNYENKSWAIYTDSLTALGTFQPKSDLTWDEDVTWEQANFTWVDRPSNLPAIVGGNQQGFIEYIGGTTESGQTTNDQSLYIKDIQGFGVGISDNPVIIVSPSHNMQSGYIIQITDISVPDPFYAYLNNGIFQITKIDDDSFYLTEYDPSTQQYNLPALAPSGTYTGNAQIRVRDNFRIISKKFNFMDLGQQFQFGWVDILMDVTDDGAIAMNIYTDYNTDEASNILPQNAARDTFFNSVIPTNTPEQSIKGGNKTWHRAICPTNSNFITIEYTLNNEQMQNQCQESDVNISAQIIYARPGGRQGITI